MNDDGKTALWRNNAVLLGHDTEVVVARLHVAERYLIDARLQPYPLFVVDTIAVDDVLGVVKSQRRQPQGKRVVARTQHETV